MEPGREGSSQGLQWAELPWSLSLLSQLHCFQEVKALLALLGSNSWQCLVHCIVLEMDCGWVSLCRANPPPEEMPWCEGNSESVLGPGLAAIDASEFQACCTVNSPTSPLSPLWCSHTLPSGAIPTGLLLAKLREPLLSLFPRGTWGHPNSRPLKMTWCRPWCGLAAFQRTTAKT